MGLHIQAWHYQGQKQVTDDPGGPATVPDLQAVESWDSFRYTGDGEIPEAVEYTSAPWSDDTTYYRPQQIPELRKWVLSNIPPDNQHRWLALLDLMEVDEDIWLVFSY